MAATKGHGTILQVSISAVFTTIAQRVTVKLPAPKRAKIETTDLDSTWETSVAGLKRGDQIVVTGNYDPALASQAYLWASYGLGTVESWKLILADAGAAEFACDGWITEFDPGEGVTDQLVRFSITIEITGAVTLTP